MGNLGWTGTLTNRQNMMFLKELVMEVYSLQFLFLLHHIEAFSLVIVSFANQRIHQQNLWKKLMIGTDLQKCCNVINNRLKVMIRWAGQAQESLTAAMKSQHQTFEIAFASNTNKQSVTSWGLELIHQYFLYKKLISPAKILLKTKQLVYRRWHGSSFLTLQNPP